MKDKNISLIADEYVEETENPIWETMRKELHPDQIEQMQLEQRLAVCELDHAGDPRGPGPYQAENTIMIKPHDGESGDMMAIHVCNLCAYSLAEKDSDWYLFICFTCLSTKWVYKDDLHREYTEQIVGMNECPNCVAKTSTH